MEQLYFLSIVFNSIAGLIIISDTFSEKYPFFEKLSNVAKNVGFRLIFSLLTVIIAVIKLVWPFDGIPVIGDLFPALAGIITAMILMLDYMNAKNETPSESMIIMNSIFLKNKFIFGIGAIVISIMHFFIPNIPPF